MNPTAQSGIHPDAESLTLLAEQLLPEAERDQILAHMATCRRCREVVFLAQHAASEEDPAPAAASAPAIRKQRSTWFNGWSWLWIPATAFAGLIGVAVFQHFRHVASETQMTAKLSETDDLRKAEPAKAPVASPQSIAPAPESLKAKTANPSEAQDKERDNAPLKVAKDGAKQLDEKKQVQRNELAAEAAGAPLVVSPALSGGSIHGTTAARAKGSPVDGPSAANQFQQQNLARQDALQQNNIQQSQDSAASVANKPMRESVAPTSASQMATVQADKVEMSSAAAAAPPAQVSSMPLADKNYEISPANIAALAKAKKITLPSGLGTLSVASDLARSIALDAVGAMFLSEDGGKQWQPIQTQWAGRAVLVRAVPIGTHAAALKTLQTKRFELVNDEQQTWISFDGKTWTPEPPAEK
jgi:hypothetical protein